MQTTFSYTQNAGSAKSLATQNKMSLISWDMKPCQTNQPRHREHLKDETRLQDFTLAELTEKTDLITSSTSNTTSSMWQDSSQLLTWIAFADTIYLQQLWSCRARPVSNKDEIWCSMLGSPLMRGEGELSGNTKHPASCLWLAGISQEEGGAASLPHFCQCALCVSVQYLKTTHARLCYSQLPSSWHGNWKTSLENNKESLACCACCQ